MSNHKRHFALIALFQMAPLLIAQAPSYPPVPAEPSADSFGRGISRTMRLLSTSTPDRRHTVRILFYGQSITKQEWALEVANDLRSRFPFADLNIENRAIGGYASEFLVQTVAHDVFAFYPDLIVFHDFGAEDNYEKIIAGIRQNTTAEILIQNDYPTWTPVDGTPDPPARVKSEAFHELHSHQWLPDLCRRYGCEVVDVRTPWYQYLQQNHLTARQLTTDGTHLNRQGNFVLAELTKRHFRVASQSPAPPELVRVIPASELHWKQGKLNVEFQGNRIDVVAEPGPPYHQEEAAVTIDGKKPSLFPELYFITRPTDTFNVDWPAVNRVTHINSLIAEEWTLKVLETNEDDSRWRFEVSGSKTGPDGEGDSTKPFVSKSGRVAIHPNEWGVNRAYKLNHKLTPVGFQVRWQVLPMFTDVYRAPRVADFAKEYIITLASGLTNAKHVLELSTADPTMPPIREVRVYRPEGERK